MGVRCYHAARLQTDGATDEIPVFKPLLEPEEFAACEESLRVGWLGPGAYVGRFEEALAKFLGAEDRRVVAVSTGHAALHLALLRMGVGPGDEVVTPSFNNIADFQAIRATGAEPVFCDIDPRTLCIDPASAERAIGPRTKVLIAMDYACHICDHDRLQALAAKRGLRVLHDAAHAFGSRHNGRMIGSFSDIATFSFDPVKTITTIDGGALVVKGDDDLRWLREARLIGMGQPAEVMYQNRRAWTYDVAHIGFRYHLANLHGALGVAQLAKMDRIERTRLATARRYSAGMAGVEGLGLPETDFSGVLPFMYYVRVPPERRDDFKAHLKQKGVDTGLHWQPGHWFSFFKGCRRDELPVTEKVAREIVSIPFHSAMPEAWVERVIAAVRGFFGAGSRA
jgi:dTDP-4-amino-4,6-dideoxygalactose transaminase